MNGTPCISPELAPPDKQEICTSRAFGKMTSDFNEVKAAVVRYLSSSARKLRDQHSYARRIYVGIETNPFNEYQRQTFRGLQIEFPVPTDNTFEMVPYAMTLLRAILAGLRPRRTSVPVQTRYCHVVGPYSRRSASAQHVSSSARYRAAAAFAGRGGRGQRTAEPRQPPRGAGYGIDRAE